LFPVDDKVKFEYLGRRIKIFDEMDGRFACSLVEFPVTSRRPRSLMVGVVDMDYSNLAMYK